MSGKNRIMIFGPKDEGSYVVDFRTEGEAANSPDRACRGRPALSTPANGLDV
jgi:hypothetical protein